MNINFGKMLKKAGYIIFSLFIIGSASLASRSIKPDYSHVSVGLETTPAEKKLALEQAASLTGKRYEVWPKYHWLSVRDAEKIREYYPKAEAGDPHAQVEVAKLLSVGHIAIHDLGGFNDCFGPCSTPEPPQYSEILKDNNKALIWLRAAAGQGDTEGEVQLGQFYADQAEARQELAKGQGGLFWEDSIVHGELDTLDNAAEAMKLFEKAASQGDADGMQRLAWNYERGDIVPKNHTEAMKWFLRAAEHGDPEMPCFLAQKFSESHGDITQDMEKAYFWISICNPSQNYLLKELQKKIKGGLTAEQTNAIDHRVEQWQKNPPQYTGHLLHYSN
jgi:TPR repeat protein